MSLTVGPTGQEKLFQAGRLVKLLQAGIPRMHLIPTSSPVLHFSLQVLNKRRLSLPGLCPPRSYTCCELLLACTAGGTVGDQNHSRLRLFSQKDAAFLDVGRITILCKHTQANSDGPAASSGDPPLAQPWANTRAP